MPEFDFKRGKSEFDLEDDDRHLSEYEFGLARKILRPETFLFVDDRIIGYLAERLAMSGLSIPISQIQGFSLAGFVPVGAILPYAVSTAPTDWLLCDGAAVSRDTCALLFGVIGTTYGVGDGSTTFNLPNLKGRVPVGHDSSQTEFDSLGETGGSKTRNHTHPMGTKWDNYAASGAKFAVDQTPTGATNISILQPYLVLNYIIKC